MRIVYDIGDHMFAKYLRDHNVDWDKTQTLKDKNLFYDRTGKLIAIDIYNESGSARKFTILGD